MLSLFFLASAASYARKSDARVARPRLEGEAADEEEEPAARAPCGEHWVAVSRAYCVPAFR